MLNAVNCKKKIVFLFVLSIFLFIYFKEIYVKRKKLKDI